MFLREDKLSTELQKQETWQVLQKKATTTLNSQQILIFASCLVVDSKNDCIKFCESSTKE